MYIPNLVKKYYEKHLEDIEPNILLREKIAHDLWQKPNKLISFQFLMKKSFLYPSFGLTIAVFLTILILPTHTVKAMGETFGYAFDHVKSGFHILINRPFNPNQDQFSDEDLEEFKNDPSITGFEYTRDENGEEVKFEQTCDISNDICTLEFLPSEVSGENQEVSGTSLFAPLESESIDSQEGELSSTENQATVMVKIVNPEPTE